MTKITDILKQAEKEFDGKFPLGSDNLEEQTHWSYPCYVTELQQECLKEYLRCEIEWAIKEAFEATRVEEMDFEHARKMASEDEATFGDVMPYVAGETYCNGHNQALSDVKEKQEDYLK